MTQIICRATNCLFWEHGICSLEEIEYEPDVGCLTFQDMGDLELEDEEAEEEFDWAEEAGDDWDEDDEWDDDDDDWEDIF